MDEERRQRAAKAPSYEGEDLSQTTVRELRGFYAYGLAAEVFAICGVGSFLPVTLEQLARERGVLWSDKTTPCTAKAAESAGNASVAAVKMLARAAAERDKDQCVVNIGGIEVTTASFAMYTFSLAVLVQAISLISFSAVADHGNYRKKLLLGFGFSGAITSMLFIFIVPEIFIIAPFLAIIGVTCLGSSFVVLNSFLPLLAGNHPSVQGTGNSRQEGTVVPLESFSPGLRRRESTEHDEWHHIDDLSSPNRPKTDSIALKISTEISAKGVGIGYMAALFVQLLSIGLLYLMSKVKGASLTIAVRMVLFFVGVWWFVGTIPAYLYLRDRPGPPLKSALSKGNRLRSFLAYLSHAWASLWKTIRISLKLPQVILFLVAWFLLSDAVATVSGTAILFARTELKMGTIAVAILSIIATSSGITGAFIWPIIARRFALKTNQTIVMCLILMQIIPLYGLSSYIIPDSWPVGGLRQAWEIYPLGVVHGFVMGGLSAYCRSFYGRLIPPGSEVAFYALYAITDKGSSAVGPAVVGYIVDLTGHIRPAFVFLAVLIAFPIPLIWLVDVEKGQADAVMMAAWLKTTDSDDELDGGVDDEIMQEAGGLMRDHD